MSFLTRMNGWQRLWLALTVAALLAYGIVYPFIYAGAYVFGSYHYEERQHLLKDLASPNCSKYATKPLIQLEQPGWGEGGSCYHLYQARKYGDPSVVPFKIETFDEWTDRRYYENLSWTMAITSAITLVCAGLVYFLGFVIAWIRRGFAKPT